MNKILYTGAGLHTEIINHFKDVKEFVFIDSQPRTEYGYRYYYKPFYRDIYDKLINKLENDNFKLYDKIQLTNNFEEINKPHLESTKLCFKNTNNIKLNYYISTSMPYDYYDNEILQNEIKECDTLIISGHYPHFIFIEDIKKPFDLILYSNTFYIKDLDKIEDDEDAKNTIIEYILKYPENVKSYTYVNSKTGDKNLFNTYNDFYNHWLINNNDEDDEY